jgi:hypothetical protein
MGLIEYLLAVALYYHDSLYALQSSYFLCSIYSHSGYM